MTKDTLVITVEPELKDLLQNVASSKRISLSEYTRHVIEVGLDEIHKRNLRVRELGKQFNVQ
jgi:predicted DNA-binding protein